MWNDPKLLQVWETILQWAAILLVFLGAAVEIGALFLESKKHWQSRLRWIGICIIVFGGLIQILTLIVSNREKALTAVLARSVQLQEQAQQGSWQAYQELLELANKPGPFQKEIDVRLKLVRKEILVYRDIPGFGSGLKFRTNSGKNVPKESLTALQLFEHFSRSSSSVQMRQSLQRYILKKPKNDILQACHAILAKSDSLPARAAACGILSRVLGAKADFFDFQAWEQISQSEIERNANSCLRFSEQIGHGHGVKSATITEHSGHRLGANRPPFRLIPATPI